jgi:hypothetical protein
MSAYPCQRGKKVVLNCVQYTLLAFILFRTVRYPVFLIVCSWSFADLNFIVRCRVLHENVPPAPASTATAAAAGRGEAEHLHGSAGAQPQQEPAPLPHARRTQV